MSSKVRHAPPKAEILIEALRGLGYSTMTAIADIIDNSISAEANEIDIVFYWDTEKSAISISDNGKGMLDPELELAMNIGSIDPNQVRQGHDLGRFGLGLKTASFSQCRKLTVASKKQDSNFCCLRWDLDKISDSPGDGWYILEGSDIGSERYIEPFYHKQNGTIVLWEVLDKALSKGGGEQEFLNLIDDVEIHLAMIFHRYLEEEEIIISINGVPISPWDPFCLAWGSNGLPEVSFPIEDETVRVKCFILPKKERFQDDEYINAGGPKGWVSQQGFYLYRNRRLLIAGSWLGLGRVKSWPQEDAFKNVRIRLDIGNKNDTDWDIDIRKSAAKPPVYIKERLIRIAEDARDRARKFHSNNSVIVPKFKEDESDPAWKVERRNGALRYRINSDAKFVNKVLDNAGDQRNSILEMLQKIEESVPVMQIDISNKPLSKEGLAEDKISAEAPEAVKSMLLHIYKNMVRIKGQSPVLARELLLKKEPFNNYPELIALLPENFDEEE